MSFDYEQALQALGGYGALRAMVNLRDCVHGENYVRFRFSGNRSMTHCMLSLNDNDLYDLKLTQCRGVNEYVRHEAKNLYAEDVAGEFSRATGLAVRVPRIVGVNA